LSGSSSASLYTLSLHDALPIFMGSGGPSTHAIVRAADTTREKDPRKIGPFEVPKAMCSGPSAALATSFQIKGTNYSISSACATRSEEHTSELQSRENLVCRLLL